MPFNMVRDYILLLRPHQYTKNLMLFLPAFFGLRIGDIQVVLSILIGFVAFSLIASGVYILNDYRDRKEDAAHPIKKDRPLASGRVSVRIAFLLMGFVIAVGLGIFVFLDKYALYLVTAYVFLNVLYTFRLKHIAIIDISIIALGFVIRVAVGSMIVKPTIPLSMWLILMMFLGALFLALAKRRDDVLLASDGMKVRKAIDGYNLEFINSAMVVMASVLIVAYISYTISPEIQEKFNSHNLYITVFFVILGVLRYMQITFVEEKSGSPTKILVGDLFLQVVILCWIIAFAILIY
ncbi:MAG: UbiA prenyltransferase family protein [Bacteroidia bacterium]|nr:UbiA prenyltransferase family protein [Bacteroidia bacterium]